MSNPSTKLHLHLPLQYQEQLIFVSVVMPHKVALHARQLHLEFVHVRRNVGGPGLLYLTERRRERYFPWEGRSSPGVVIMRKDQKPDQKPEQSEP